MEIYYEFDEFSKTLIKKIIKNNGDIKFDFFEDRPSSELEGIIKSSKYSKWIRDNLNDDSAIENKLINPYINYKFMNDPINYSDIGSTIKDKLNVYIPKYPKYSEDYAFSHFKFSEEFKTEHT